MKILAIAVLSIFIFSFYEQDQPNQILWSKKHLKWRDFKGTPDSTGPHAKAAAVTSSRLEQRYYKTANNEIHFIIAAWFNPARSWVKESTLKSNGSDRTLDHEQHHFDMCELYARKIRKYLSTAVFTDSTYRQKIPELFKTFHKEYRTEQERYDSEVKVTRQSLDDWTSSIDDEMKQLSKFSDTLVVVKLQ